MFTWNENFSVGIEEIDNQHKELLTLIGKLFTGARFKKDIIEISDLTTEIISFAEHHFMTESRYMRKYNYPDIEHHENEHDEIIKRLKEYKFELRSYNVDDFASELMILLKSWFVNHLTYTDKKLFDYLTPLKDSTTKL